MKIIRIVIILSVCFVLSFPAPGRSATPDGTLSPAWSPLVITSPTSLTPMPDPRDPLCKTYWYIIDNAGGYPAYLTLNVTDAAGSTNSGEWRPNIPTTGFYQVEVYIPSHGLIDWSCVIGGYRSLDTNHAQYTISSPSGSKNVIVDQAANAGTWISLGNYYLAKGIGNALSLNDITGEPNLERLVSFSMARFTWLPSQSSTYLPVIYKDFDQASLTKVTLDSVVPYAREGISRIRFDMDEPVTYRISGNNGYPSPETTRLTWQYSGPCGYSPESEITLTLPVGSWSYDLATSITACAGQNNAYIRIYSRGVMLLNSLSISVDGGGKLQLFQGHAFDACSLPSLDDFKIWWNQSPYEVYNIYLGGISFPDGCKSTRLNRDFIKDVQNIGWGFIATWVGPQAPCSDLKYKFSMDLGSAYNEGKNEAQMAYTKAIILGLVEAANANSILYYDMEGYSFAKNAQDPTVRLECRNAVKWFLQGWVDQLHSYGIYAAAYGGTSSSYISDWWNITSRPDAIWAAQWYKIDGQYQFDPQASVYDISLPTEYWNPNQRIHQYAGDHDETWGGRKVNIDSNVVDTTLLLPRFPIVKPPIALDQALIGSAQVADFQLLTPDQGWLLDRGKLYWTEDGGFSWQALSIPLPESADLAKAFFLNSSQGWLLVSSQAGFMLLSTTDGGMSWQSLALPENGPVDPLGITFLDPKNGTLKFRFQTSQAFREGYVLTTADGGLTWQMGDLAQDDPAWDQGQPGRAAKSSAGEPSAPNGALQVKWISSSQGWARVFRGACSGGGVQSGYTCKTAIVLVSTLDGGLTWQEIYR